MAAEESKTVEKHEKPNSSTLYIDTLKSVYRASSSIPSSPVGLRKSLSIKQNCLCSPTTHAGSFRCRHHRSAGLTRNSMSVGSKLSELTGKSTDICTHLIAGQNHSS